MQRRLRLSYIMYAVGFGLWFTFLATLFLGHLHGRRPADMGEAVVLGIPLGFLLLGMAIALLLAAVLSSSVYPHEGE